MKPFFRPYEPNQQFLLPPSLRDWLDEDHLAFFVSDTVDSLDLGMIESTYRGEGGGNVAYHPALMLKLLIYGYATGVFSSRRIARACLTDIAFRLLAAGDPPSHRTLARFRKRHLKAFGSLFGQVVRVAQDAGILDLDSIAIDGSKVRANASKHKAMSYERMKNEEKRLKKEIDALIAHAEDIDAAEDAALGPDVRGDEVPKEIATRKARRKFIRESLKRLEERKKAEDAEAIEKAKKADAERKASGKAKTGPKRKHPLGKPKPTDQENFTDADSRIMKAKGAYEQCYNAQIAVDAKERIIVATGVAQSPADNGQLIPMIDAAAANTGRAPRKVLADAGYRSDANFQAMEEREIEGYVALGREGSKRATTIAPHLEATHRMKRRMATKRGRKRYRKRKHIAEPPFGWIKGVLGFRQFHLRGIDAVRGEWDLVCTAMNLRRMATKLTW